MYISVLCVCQGKLMNVIPLVHFEWPIACAWGPLSYLTSYDVLLCQVISYLVKRMLQVFVHNIHNHNHLCQHMC